MIAATLAYFGIIVMILAGWVTNILWTFNQKEVIDLILGIVGIFAFPIGAIHGIYLWF